MATDRSSRSSRPSTRSSMSSKPSTRPTERSSMSSKPSTRRRTTHFESLELRPDDKKNIVKGDKPKSDDFTGPDTDG